MTLHHIALFFRCRVLGTTPPRGGVVPAGENGCRTIVSGEGRRRKLYQPLEPSPSWHHGAALGVRRSCCGKAARSHRLQGSCISLGVEVHRLQGARSRVLYKPFVSTAWAPFAPDGGPLQLSSSAGIEFPQFVGTCPAMCGSSESRSHLVSSTTSNSQGDPTPPVQLRSSGSSCCACNGCSACYGCCPFCTQSQKVPGLIRSSSQPLLGLPPSGSGYRRLSAGASQSG